MGEEASLTSQHTALDAAASNSAGSECSALANAVRRLERLRGQNARRSSIAISEICASSVGAGWPAEANDSAMLDKCCQLKSCGERLLRSRRSVSVAIALNKSGALHPALLNPAAMLARPCPVNLSRHCRAAIAIESKSAGAGWLASEKADTMLVRCCGFNSGTFGVVTSAIALNSSFASGLASANANTVMQRST